jgi:hypothetical protein
LFPGSPMHTLELWLYFLNSRLAMLISAALGSLGACRAAPAGCCQQWQRSAVC